MLRRVGVGLLKGCGFLVGATTLYVVAHEDRRTQVIRGGRLLAAGVPVVWEYNVSLPRAEKAAIAAAEGGEGSAAAEAALAILRSAVHERCAQRLLALARANGGIYVKVAQALSTNTFTLPPEYCRVLAEAQDRARFRPWAEVAAVFEEDFGLPAASVFASVDEAPVAAASIAQVHRGVTADGRDVAIKIQYPELRHEARSDIVAIRFAAALLELAMPAFGYSWLLPDIEASLRAELNFLQEARNGERMAAMLSGDVRLHVPAVFGALSSERVLVQEWIQGCRITDAPGLVAAGVREPREVADALCSAFSAMWFVHGFVHCDPHAGNLLVRRAPAGASVPWQLVIIDHGMYRRCTGPFRIAFSGLFRALLLGDAEGGLAGVRALGMEDSNLEALSLILAFRPLGGIAAGPLGGRLAAKDAARLRAAGKAIDPMDVNRFLQRMPRDLLFLLRSINMIRGANATLGGTTRSRLVVMGEAAVLGLAVPAAAGGSGAGVALDAAASPGDGSGSGAGDPLLAPAPRSVLLAGLAWLRAALGREPVRERVTYLNALAAGLATAAPTDSELDAAARARYAETAPWAAALIAALRGLAARVDVARLTLAIAANDALFALFFALTWQPAPDDKRTRGRPQG